MRLLLQSSLALLAVGSLTLTACTQATDTVQQAAGEMAEGASNAALTAAVNPVLDLLRKGQAQVNDGNLETATVTMGGFASLWQKAAPVIQPLAGDKWPMINTAAELVQSTFSAGTTPDAANATAAISGMMGPLKALIGQ
jgi:hypothetical protein